MTRALALGWALLLAAFAYRRIQRPAAAARALQLRRKCLASRKTVPLPPVLRRLWRPLAEHRRRRLIEAEVRREMPLVVEIVRLAVTAGCTPAQALRVATVASPPATSAALASAVRGIDVGLGFDEALHPLRQSTRLRPLADALATSSELGASVGETLGRLGAEARAEFRRSAEARARAVSVRLLFPLVFLVLPAFLLLGVAPSIIAGFGA